MVNLKIRSSELELMDDFSSGGEMMTQTLKELENVNQFLGGTSLTISSLNQVISKNKTLGYTIADLGCGGGYTLKHLSDWAKKKNLKLNLIGVDANPNIIEIAKKNTCDYSNIDFLAEDIFSSQFKEKKFDIIHSSLFTHHFTDEEFIDLLKIWKQQAKVAIVINDLHRHWVSYYFTKWVIRALSKSEMVRFDSVLSIQRSFKRKELISILEKAGIKNYKLSWKWAFRWKIVVEL